MRDYRNDIINDLQFKVMTFLDPEQSAKVVATVSGILDAYELTERSTEIVPFDNANIKLLKTYISHLALNGRSERTVYVYKRQLIRFMEFTGGKNLKETTTFDIRNYLANEKARGLSNTTLENTRMVLRSFFHWLIDEEYIIRNPCAAVKPIKVNQEIRLPFSSIEQDQLKGACNDEKERALIEFLLASGVRVSELVNLDLTDINFNDKSVHVRHGKGDKERYTYINEVAMKYLIDYLMHSNITSGPLFLSRKKKRYTAGGIRYLLKQIEKRSAVQNVHPHRFRRTFATTLAARGMQVQDIQKLMGHTDINTTMKYITIDFTQIHGSYQKYTA